MKLLLPFFLCLCSVSLLLGQEASSFYHLSIPITDSFRNVEMVAYQGKKVLVAVCDANKPDTQLLHQLNDLQQEYQARLVVIVIPVNDLTVSSKPGLTNQWQDMSGTYQVSRPSSGKKASGSAQHPLLRWVTNQSENRHFDHDIKGDGYLFVISETGRLFAILKYNGMLKRSVIQPILESKVPNN